MEIFSEDRCLNGCNIVAKSWLGDCFEVSLKYADYRTLAYSTVLTCAELLDMFVRNRRVTLNLLSVQLSIGASTVPVQTVL